MNGRVLPEGKIYHSNPKVGPAEAGEKTFSLSTFQPSWMVEEMFEKRKERRVRDTEVSKKVFSEEARDTKRSVSKGNWDNEKTYSQNDRKENEKVRKKRDKRSKREAFQCSRKRKLLWERGGTVKR